MKAISLKGVDKMLIILYIGSKKFSVYFIHE